MATTSVASDLLPSSARPSCPAAWMIRCSVVGANAVANGKIASARTAIPAATLKPEAPPARQAGEAPRLRAATFGPGGGGVGHRLPASSHCEGPRRTASAGGIRGAARSPYATASRSPRCTPHGIDAQDGEPLAGGLQEGNRGSSQGRLESLVLPRFVSHLVPRSRPMSADCHRQKRRPADSCPVFSGQPPARPGTRLSTLRAVGSCDPLRANGAGS